MPGAVIIVDYDPRWPDRFEAAAAAIRGACGERLVGIEHVGSTAVPGLPAKPIIDLMPLVARFEDGAACVEAMTALGYEYRGEFGIPGRHYFVRNESGQAEDERPQEHVHMLVAGSDEAERHLLFRDYLRTHPERRDAYAILKRALALRHGEDREAYTAGKTAFVQATLALAARWRHAPPA
jgi:GrpB-like predicted nucleotidyltransferase (UPF0157 family)